MTRTYCGHVCSHPSDVDCVCECDCDGWLAKCEHDEVCADPYECGRRHETCRCADAHDTETECRAWLRENPPDVDVRTESDDH